MIKRQKEEEKKEEPQSIQPRDIAEELRESYLDYAMSVIISRALPDTRDGLKPVQRRILYTMHEEGLHPSAKLRKSATVVGAALGRYHPHGDTAVYDALVRMAQDFSLRYPLIQGQGNMGSVDNDPPAAARYTEARLSKIAEDLLTDIEKETVDWQSNYDGTREEPKVLPGKIPQLILNGAMGIAVGMATNIPPHNLKEVTEAIIYLIDHPQATAGDLINFVKGPDFPTGGIIYGKEKILETYANGKGTILCRAKTEIIEDDKKKMILVTEIPYQVNKANLIEKIAQLVEEKRIEGIKDLRDESDKEGLRIAIDLHHNAAPNRIFNQLFKYTELEKSFHINILALTENGLQPQILSLKNLLEEYIKHRKEVIHRRTEFLLRKAKERIHILEGLATALQHIDEIIKLIKSSESKEEAQEKLMKKYRFTEIQANAILEMKLSSLAKLEKQKIEDELKEKQKLAKEHELILREPKRIMEIIKTELKEIRDKYGDERKTKVEINLPGEVPEEDLIPSKESIITFSQTGYIKRMSPEELKAQKRGGKGVIGYEIKSEDDIITHILSCNSRDKIFFFANKGHLFEMPAFEIAEGLRTWRGKIIQNYLNLRSEEKIIVFLNLPVDKKSVFKYLIIATEQGMIKKTLLTEYENIRKGGIIAINLSLSDNLVGAALTSGDDEIILASQKGQAIRFSEKELRSMGRTAAGVKGMKLAKDDKVISFITASQQKIKTNPQILVISENGFGKKTELKEYRRQKRGGSGIKTVKITAKTGNLIKILMIEEQEEFIVISQKAQILKAPLTGVPILRRTAQGVKIMRLESKDKVAGITLF